MSAVETNEERTARLERENKDREEQLRRVPLQTIDKSKWPKDVRPIAWPEIDGLGIDPDGRLHWNGKPVEIIGRRLDLTRTQAVVGLVVAFFTIVGGIGAAVQGWAAYHDWACKNKRPSIIACPIVEIPVVPRARTPTKAPTPSRAAFARSPLPSTAGCAWMVAGRGISKMRILGIVALGAAWAFGHLDQSSLRLI